MEPEPLEVEPGASGGEVRALAGAHLTLAPRKTGTRERRHVAHGIDSLAADRAADEGK